MPITADKQRQPPKKGGSPIGIITVIVLVALKMFGPLSALVARLFKGNVKLSLPTSWNVTPTEVIVVLVIVVVIVGGSGFRRFARAFRGNESAAPGAPNWMTPSQPATKLPGVLHIGSPLPPPTAPRYDRAINGSVVAVAVVLAALMLGALRLLHLI